MDLQDIYKEITVKIIYFEEQGSGWMYNPPDSNYTYVFTAKHCFSSDELNGTGSELKLDTIKKEDIDINNIKLDRFISRKIGWQGQDKYKVKDIFFAQGIIDIAIIRIDRIKLSRNVKLLSLTNKINKNIFIYGYPNVTASLLNPTKKLDDFTINDIDEDYIELRHENLNTFNYSSKDVMDSFSGSGLFIYDENQFQICIIGIFTGLGAPDGAYNHYIGENLEPICDIINENQLEKIDIVSGDFIQYSDYYCNIEQWTNINPIAYKRKWVNIESAKELIDDIIMHFKDYSTYNIKYVVGPSGCGKTRTVYEACNRFLYKSSIMYFDKYSNDVINVMNSLRNKNEKYYIVIDEVDVDAYQEINRKFLLNNLRIILIGVAKEYEKFNDNSICYKEPPTETEVNKIISGNNNFLDDDQIRKITSLSKSDLRLAFLIQYIWQKDGEVSIGEKNGVSRYTSLGQIFEKIIFQYKRIIGDENKFKNDYSKLCTLLDIGFKDYEGNELKLLSDYYNVDKNDFLKVIETASKCMLGEKKFNFFEPCPRVLSNYIFEKEIWPLLKNDFNTFMDSINDIMRKRFRDRIKECEESVRKEGEEAFASRFLEKYNVYDLNLINSEEKAKMFRFESEFIPNVTLRWIYESLLASLKEKDNLNMLFYSTRRNIVWMLEHLTVFEDCFYECEKSLLLLGENETELRLGNNSSSIWSSLFSIFLSNTSIPFNERSKLFFKRMDDIPLQNYNLISQSISIILINRSFSRIVPPNVIGGRLVPKLWEPKENEVRNLQSEFLNNLLDKLNSIENKKHDFIIKYFIDNITSFVNNGFGGEILDYIINNDRVEHNEIILLRAHMENTKNALLTLDKLNFLNQYTFDFVEKWIDKIKLKCIDDLFLFIINLVYYRLDKDRRDDYIENIANQLLENKFDFDKYTNYMQTKLLEKEVINQLFFSIGKIDIDRFYFPYIIKLFKDKILTNLVVQYIRGNEKSNNSIRDKFIELLDEYKDREPDYILHITTLVDLTEEGFNRIINIIGKGINNFKTIENLRYYEWNQFLDENKKVILFNSLKAQDNYDSYLLILYLNALWRNKTISQERADLLIDILKTKFSDIESHLWIWEDNIRLLPEECYCDKIDILIKAFQESNDIDVEDLVIKIIMEYKGEHSEIIVPRLGNAMLEKKSFISISYKGVFESFNIVDVKNWVEEKGERAAIIIACHMLSPKPTEEDNIYVPELTRWILEKFETNDKVYLEFKISRYNMVGYSVGEIIQNREKLINEKKPYLNHPLRRIREWAEYEINRYNEIVENDKKMIIQEERYN
ncbi:hypothetical protein [Clostridium butyricum]|uniref:hypothetical protein n=2 Tax=Clostridium butyricum TaxID=1492 RepID=UPI00325BD27E